jgi:hypothetical protein
VTADPTRRALLAAAAALPLVAVAGCKGVGALAPPPSPAPDVGLLKAAIAGEQQLIARYQEVAVSLRPHRLAATLEPLLAEHQSHLAQLESRLIVPSGAASASPSPSATGTPGPARPGATGGTPGPGRTARSAGSPAPGGAAGTGVPTRPGAAFAFLRAAEQQASAALLSQLRAAPPSLAQLLASISASEATHAAILHAAGRAG